jgi:hypothetical protein
MKARFEELAKTWMRLASDLEHAKRLVEEWDKAKPNKTA